MVFAKFSMEKKEETSIPVVIQPSAGAVVKKSNQARYVIIGVTVTAVTLVVVGGFLGAMYLLRDTANTALKTSSHSYEDEDGKTVEETTEEFPHDISQYTVNRPDGKYVVIEDFGRRLKVLKALNLHEPACLLNPLNETKADTKLTKEGDVPTGTLYEYLDIDYHRIRDHDILGAHAQKMCEGLPLYWAVPAVYRSDAGLTTTGGRQKRDVIVGRYICSTCYCYGCVRTGVSSYSCARCTCYGCRLR